MTGRGNEIPVKGSDGRRRAVNLLLLLSRMDFSAEQKRLIAEEIRLFDEGNNLPDWLSDMAWQR